MRHRLILPDGIYNMLPVLAWLIHAGTALLIGHFVSLYSCGVVGAVVGLIYFLMFGLVSFVNRFLYDCTLPRSYRDRLKLIAKEELVFHPGSIEYLYRYVPRDLDDPLLTRIAEEMGHLYLARKQRNWDEVENVRQRLRDLMDLIL